MQLDELKKSMSTLDQLLAKTNTDIKINVSTCLLYTSDAADEL